MWYTGDVLLAISMDVRLDIDLSIHLIIKVTCFVFFYILHILKSVYWYLKSKHFKIISLWSDMLNQVLLDQTSLPDHIGSHINCKSSILNYWNMVPTEAGITRVFQYFIRGSYLGKQLIAQAVIPNYLFIRHSSWRDVQNGYNLFPFLPHSFKTPSPLTWTVVTASWFSCFHTSLSRFILNTVARTILWKHQSDNVVLPLKSCHGSPHHPDWKLKSLQEPSLFYTTCCPLPIYPVNSLPPCSYSLFSSPAGSSLFLPQSCFLFPHMSEWPTLFSTLCWRFKCYVLNEAALCCPTLPNSLTGHPQPL